MEMDFDREIDETTESQREMLMNELQNYDVEIQELIQLLTGVLTKSALPSLKEAQAKWEAYRSADADFTAHTFEGGTAAKLAKLARMVELSENWIRDLRNALALARAQ